MADSILTDIKQMIGINETGTAFDIDIRLWINSAFSTLNQIGIGPPDGFSIEGNDETWDAYLDEGPILDMVKTYVYMKTKYAFDPPGTGYHTSAAAEIIREHEVRLSYAREHTEWVPPVAPEPIVLDPFGDPIL